MPITGEEQNEVESKEGNKYDALLQTYL